MAKGYSFLFGINLSVSYLLLLSQVLREDQQNQDQLSLMTFDYQFVAIGEYLA